MYLLMIFVLVFIIAASYPVKHKDNFYYWHNTAVDSNSVLLGSMFKTLNAIAVSPTGTDVEFDITIYLDPPELGEVADSNQITIATIADVNALAGNFLYVLPSADSSANVFGGIPVCGEVYIGITDANSTTLTDIKVWLIHD